MRNTTRSHRKMALLALASVALLTSAVHAQTVTTSLGDLILGFRATGGTGAGLNLEVDLGSISNFYNAAPGATIPLPALSVQDLSNTYGADWFTDTNLFWGAAATDGNTVPDPNGKPASTLWATGKQGGTVPLEGTSGLQSPPASKIGELYSGGIGSLNGAASTPNSAAAAVIGNTLTGSWSVQETGANSFGFFSPKIDGQVSGDDVLTLYELQPSSDFPRPAANAIGNLELTQNGVTFVPEPATWELVGLGFGVSVMALRRRKAIRA